jgi:excisionase family DNA binding protein
VAEYLKIPEVAHILGLSEKTVRRRVKAGEIPSVFIGGVYRISRADLDEYLELARVRSGKAEAPPSQEKLFNNGVPNEERRELEPEVAGLLRSLAKRARLIAQTSRRQGGPSAELGEQVELFYEEVAHVLALRRLLPRWGAESDELADAEDAYEEAEKAIRAMIRQDLEATDEERREARGFRSGAEDARGRREADAS